MLGKRLDNELLSRGWCSAGITCEAAIDILLHLRP